MHTTPQDADGVVPKAPVARAAATFLFKMAKNGWKSRKKKKTQHKTQMA